MSTEGYLERAIELAQEAVEHGRGGPFGAVVVRDGQVLGEGGNEVLTTLDPTSHAEIVAIRRACQKIGNFKLEGAVLYASCEPCPMCLGAIYWARLDALYYAATRHDAAAAGFDDQFFYDELGKQLEARSLIMRPVPLPDAGRPFAVWGEKGDRVLY